MARVSKSDRAEAIARLHEVLKPGDTVHTVLRHVSRSGMQREIDLYKIENNEPRWLTGYACNALGWRRKGDHMVLRGCGMDMGFHAVYSLSRVLFSGGFGCIGKSGAEKNFERCPSNDHSNGDHDYTPHMDDTPQCSEEVGADIPHKRAHRHHHKDGGYALRHRRL